jgi:hypothetical protein
LSKTASYRKSVKETPNSGSKERSVFKFFNEKLFKQKNNHIHSKLLKKKELS